MPRTVNANSEALLGCGSCPGYTTNKRVSMPLHAGLPVHTVQRICKGEGKQPSVWTIAAIARGLGVSMADLVVLPEHEGMPNAKSPTKRQRPQKATPMA